MQSFVCVDVFDCATSYVCMIYVCVLLCCVAFVSRIRGSVMAFSPYHLGNNNMLFMYVQQVLL